MSVHLFAGMVLAAGSTLGLAAPASAGNQINLPQTININPDPNIFETNITAMEAMVDLNGDGLLANSYTFNGIVPGPEFRVRVGDTVIVHFLNLLPEPSSIHWHGVELNNASDGTGVTQNETATGETYDYIFIAPRPGIFWYHAHFNPTNPEFKGQFGSFIVTSDDEQTLIFGADRCGDLRPEQRQQPDRRDRIRQPAGGTRRSGRFIDRAHRLAGNWQIQAGPTPNVSLLE